MKKLVLFRLSSCKLRTAFLIVAIGLLASGLANYWGVAQVQTVLPAQKVRPPATLPLTKFYETPRPLAPGSAGELIRSEPIRQYSLPFELSVFRILYHSRTAKGEDVAVSGVVLIPDGKPPAGGWPVIAWAHEFRGAAQQCAPSLMKNLGAGPILAMYANLGYAVVATDYSGLGSDSGKSVEDMRSNALDVMYSVRAARAAVAEIGAKWIALGTFQGALAAVAVAESDIRDPNYLGSVAVSGLSDAAEAYERFEMRSPDRMLALASTVQTLYPEFSVSNMLTSEAMPAYQHFTRSCTGEMGSDLKSTMLKSGWENDRFVKEFFSGNTPGQRTARGPILVISGGADAVIPAELSATTVSRMCKAGDRVDFLRYPNLDASGVMGASAADQISWIKARFAGDNAPSNCR
jgi:hypothetical protein